MNKILSIATIIVALVATLSFAQEGGPKFGIRAGFNLIDFSSGNKEMDKELDMGMGYGAGIIANIPISDFLSFDLGLNFYYRKLLSISMSEDYDPYGKLELEVYESEFALSIPLMLQVTPVEAVPFYLAAGVQLDIPFSPELTAKATMGGRSEEETDKIDDERAKIDFGIALGLGYNITPNFGIDLRCVIGLTGTGATDDDYEDEYGNEVKVKDKSSFNQYGVGLTYFF